MEDGDILEQVDSLLASPCISWLLGAGISYNANVPLMAPLTERVVQVLNDNGNPNLELLEALRSDLPTDHHIEHVLSHLGDFAALAERAKTNEVMVAGTRVLRDSLTELHAAILAAIAETVRWGYVPSQGGNPPKVGTRTESLVGIDEHLEFIDACFNVSRAGLQERRDSVRFFTTNYDTLLEDALALSRISYWGRILRRSRGFPLARARRRRASAGRSCTCGETTWIDRLALE